jgi:antitoxin (DNA-binding transcriptional repressor) of toxin-antitoxin stability system
MTTVQKIVDISGSQMSVQELLHLVDEGTEILLTDGNNPLARLVPISQQNVPRIAGLHQGEIWTSNDFDEPKRSILELEGLGEEIWHGIDAQEYVNHERNSWNG